MRALKGFIRSVSTLTTMGLALAIAPSANAASIVFLNESYNEAPTWVLEGWQWGAPDPLLFEWVNEGVAGSGALKMSGTFPPGAGAAICLSQHGGVAGNVGATRDNTMLSFDLKIGTPGVEYIVVTLQSWGWYLWDFYGSPWDPPYPTSSWAAIPVGKYKPGTFKNFSIALNDPAWQLDTEYPGELKGLFEPEGKTLQAFLTLAAGDSAPIGDFAATVDNFKLTTKTPLVPWAGQGAATLETSSLTEVGEAAHVGAYVLTADFTMWIATIEAADGDTLTGWMYAIGWDGDWVSQTAVEIFDGTGRFEGAKGSFTQDITWTSPLSYTTVSVGSVTPVGPTKE